MNPSNRRLLLFNLMTDVHDPVLGFTTAWICELAQHYQAIDVITMYQGEIDLPDNVRVFSAGREKGLSKPMRVLIFYRHLLKLLMTQHYDACFAHMSPLFAGLAGPLLTLRGIKTTLWYTHRQQSTQLKLGMWMSWRVISAVATSFPYQTPKLRVVGHGIDTDFYAPDVNGYQPQDINNHPTVIQVARLAVIKNQATTIQAIANTDAHAVIVGDVQTGAPKTYKTELQTLAESLNLADRVTFTGDLPAEATRDAYRGAAIAVNTSPVGLFDKAALESMACCVPTIVCNAGFSHLIGAYADMLIVDNPKNVEALHDRINRLLAMSLAERAKIGQDLREAVVQQYSLSKLTERLVQVLQTGELTD